MTTRIDAPREVPRRELFTLFSELVHGAPSGTAYILNAGDAGLLASLDRLSAAAASALPAGGGASIAAHVEHLRYGTSLMNRWAAGERNPWRDADWQAAWRRATVDDGEWATLRAALRTECHRWLDALQSPREVHEIELNGMIGLVVHLAYHLGAIRQIDRSIKGPSAND